MSGFTTDTGELFAARAVVTAAADEASSELSRLVAIAEDLLSGGWRGAAASAFDEGWQEWLAGARRMLAGLHEMGLALGATAGDYAAAEAASVAAVRG